MTSLRHVLGYLFAVLFSTSTLLFTLPSQAEIVIPDSYGQATHSTPQWQRLAHHDDPFGIAWSVDGGHSWGRDPVTVGDSVLFRLSMFKKITGTHNSDHGKLWLDLDQDGQFSQAETVLYGEHRLLDTEDGNLGQTTPNVQHLEFYSSLLHIGPEHVGDTWARGRVVCSESLTHSVGGTWNDQFQEPYLSSYNDIFSPTQHYYQGESEHWQFSVVQNSEDLNGGSGEIVAGDVNAPLLGAIGLFFLNLGLRNRRKQADSST